MIFERVFKKLFPSKVNDFVQREEARDRRIQQMKAEYAFLLQKIKKNQERIEEMCYEECISEPHVVIDCGGAVVVDSAADQHYARAAFVYSDSDDR